MTLYGYETQDDIPSRCGTDSQFCSVVLPADAGVPHRTPTDMLHAAAGGIRDTWKRLVDLGEAHTFILEYVPYAFTQRLDEVLAKVKAAMPPSATGQRPAAVPAPPDETARQRMAGLMADVLAEANRAMSCPPEASLERRQATISTLNKFELLLGIVPIERLDADGLDIVYRNIIGLFARLAPYVHPEFKMQVQYPTYEAAADGIAQKTLVMQRKTVRFAIHAGREFVEILAKNPGVSVLSLARDAGWAPSRLRQSRDFYLAVGDLTDEQITLAIGAAISQGVGHDGSEIDLDELRDFIVARPGLIGRQLGPG